MVLLDMDLIEELRLPSLGPRELRATEQRDGTWHPVIQDEMKKKDTEKFSPNQTPKQQLIPRQNQP